MQDILESEIDWHQAARICPIDAFTYVVEAPARGSRYFLRVAGPSKFQARMLQNFIKAEATFLGKPAREFSHETLDGIKEYAQSFGLFACYEIGFNYSQKCFVAMSSSKERCIPISDTNVAQARGHGFYVDKNAGRSAVHAATIVRWSAKAPPAMRAGTIIAQTDIWGNSSTVPGMQSRQIRLMDPSDVPYHVVFPSGEKARLEDIPVVRRNETGKVVIERPSAKFGAHSL